IKEPQERWHKKTVATNKFVRYLARMLNVHGQARAIGQLQRALASGRLASTWIFAGPAGVGKFTLAVELAKTVLCDRPTHRKNKGDVAGLPKEFTLTLACEK